VAGGGGAAEGEWQVKLALYILIAALALFSLCWNLGDRLLWGDEAETALLAVNITKYGVPRVDDGRNVISLYDGRDANEDGLWVWSPWLDEYLAAASIAVFGKSTVAARLPFVLAGLASLALLALLARRIYGRHDVALAAIFLCVTCVPFLLHSRQCRYYAVLMLAQIWLLWGFGRILAGARASGAAQVALALAVQFYCNYIVLPGNVAALVAVTLILRRRRPEIQPAMIAGVFGSALLAAPWLLYSSAASQLKSVRWDRFFDNAAYYLNEINAHLFPLVLLLIPLLPAAASLIKRKGRPKRDDLAGEMTVLLWMVLLFQVVVLSLSPLRYFRYLTPLIPVMALLGAVILMSRLKPLLLGILLVVVAGLSNSLSLGVSHPLGLPFITYLRSITAEYTDRFEDTVEYFRSVDSVGQTVMVGDPEFPLIFYTEMRVIDARFLRRLERAPDWILPESPSVVIMPLPLPLPPQVREEYDRVRLKVHASKRGGSRPDPDRFELFTAEETEEMTIYRSPAAATPRAVRSP
jgi:hypothetical protein